MLLSEKAYEKINRELAKYPPEQKQSATMSALAIAQVETGWLSPEVIEDVANYLGLAPIAVQEVATFYNMFNTQAVGKFKVTVCTNLPCALRRGEEMATYLKQKLGVDYKQSTLDDMFTLVEGECMGACGDAPVLLVNNHHMHIQMNEEKIDALIAELRNKAGD